MSNKTAEVHRQLGHAPSPSTLAPPSPCRDRTGGKMLPTLDVKAKLALLIMLLIAVIDHGEAGTCWLRRLEASGKCKQLFASNVTRESCCGAGSNGGKGFSERDISDVMRFFMNAYSDGMECSSCIDTCARTKCGPNKRCVMRRNRPKCICAPTCSGGGGKRQPQPPKRPNRPHPFQHQQLHQQQLHQEPRFHQQNIKVINLSESQRNRQQYFADAGRQPRPRQLRYTGPEMPTGGRSVKKSSLSENRSPGSQRASAKHGAKDSGKDKQHNLLASVTLVSSSRVGDGSSSSSRSTGTSKSTHRAGVNCTATTSAGQTPPGCSWTGGERMVLMQDGPLPNGLALNYPTGGKATATSKSKGSVSAATTPRRHHRKDIPPVHGNRTILEQTHRTKPGSGGKPTSTVVPPFVAFGKPKLLHVGRTSRKRNGTAAVRVPRREPQYMDDIFFVDNFHPQRDRAHQHRLPVEDLWGNEIMHQSSFYNPVCGTDGRTYKTECQLKKRACRQEITSLMVAYKGHCQTSCKFVQCPDGKQCIEDQNAAPHCVSCGGAECRVDRSSKSPVCGTDGITYPSICELKRQACLVGRAIPIAYRGRCKEAATCETIKCKDRQHCLTDLKTHKPRCVSCSYKCPRTKRQQGHGKPFRDAKNSIYNEHNVKLCGTNNRTYHSWCHMLKDSCSTGFYIDVLHSGTCTFGR
ncbi:uncharacterized protein LOC128724827 [Anopheles nili]|uniref:uncharacterized protein LOC128724827 n=1 Tax=Anopheles nili TaxID=185578 RepID=UPI00237B8652|nr:uncharacterized protein LOC128724827 [Anopheles nili]